MTPVEYSMQKQPFFRMLYSPDDGLFVAISCWGYAPYPHEIGWGLIA